MKELLIQPNEHGYSCYIIKRRFIFFKSILTFIKFNGSENAFIYKDLGSCIIDLQKNYLKYDEFIKLTVICK